jgi:nicotinamide-nucleotide amidase
MKDYYLAELISGGTELLRGEVVDTNAVYLASELPLLGIELQAMSTAADDREQLCLLLQQAMARSDLVIAGGGLGPTEDDLTRDCIASVLNEELTRIWNNNCGQCFPEQDGKCLPTISNRPF